VRYSASTIKRRRFRHARYSASVEWTHCAALRSIDTEDPSTVINGRALADLRQIISTVLRLNDDEESGDMRRRCLRQRRRVWVCNIFRPRGVETYTPKTTILCTIYCIQWICIAFTQWADPAICL